VDAGWLGRVHYVYPDGDVVIKFAEGRRVVRKLDRKKLVVAEEGLGIASQLEQLRAKGKEFVSVDAAEKLAKEECNCPVCKDRLLDSGIEGGILKSEAVAGLPAAIQGDRTLSLVEDVQVRNGAYAWSSAKAFLDTGNQAITLIDPVFAARHAIYKPDAAAALLGTATGFGQAERWQTIRGVVPGASTRAPVVTVALKVRDQEMTIQAAVSEMHGHDLLLGADVIARLFEAGFRLGAGSM